jgi:hypothetical protein
MADLDTSPDEILMTALAYEDFLSLEDQQKLEQEARDAQERGDQEKYTADERRRQLARDLVRREREEAEIAGTLSGDAEAFYEGTLKPKLVSASEHVPIVRVPVVQNLFVRNTLSWVAGPSGTFKSFITADLAFRYGAEDMDYYGKKMTHGRALIIVAEGEDGYAYREEAWERQYDRQIKNVDIYPGALQLADVQKEMPALLHVLKRAEEDGNPYGLIIFDTQAMCTVGIDENTSAMNLVINVLHRLRKVSGACVLIVHHFGKKESSGMRGSSMLYAAADTVLILKRQDDAMQVKLSTAQSDEGKQKDTGGEKDFLTLEMQFHDVGEDYFGDVVTSLAPVEAGNESHDTHEEADDTPLSLPDVTDVQMVYLNLIANYEHRGATASDMAEKLVRERGPIKNARQNVRNQMVDLAKMSPALVAQPVPKGPWFVTPMGVAVIARQIALGVVWTDRSGPKRRVSREVSAGQRNLDSETSETLAKPEAKPPLTSSETEPPESET